MKIFLVLLLCLVLAGCVSPYQNQANELNQAYQNGQMTYPEYVQAYQNLQALDMQYRQNMSNAFQNAGNSIQAYSQPRPMTVIHTGGSSYQTNSHCTSDGYGNIHCNTQVN